MKCMLAVIKDMDFLWKVLWIINVAFYHVQGLPNLIRIGGLFDDTEDITIENAFRYAIFRINNDNQLLGRTQLAYDIQHLRGANSFVAAKSACNQAGLGVAAIFGPRTSPLAAHINSMCNSLELPHIEARLEPQPDRTHEFSINLYPDSAELSKAFLHLVEHFQWTRFCVLYATETDLLLLQDVIRAPGQTERDILVRQVTRDTLRETLKDLEKKGVTKYIAQLDTEDTYFLLKVALQQGMIDPKHHFILTNLDLETIDLEDFHYNYVNLTGVSLINRNRGIVQNTLNQMIMFQQSKNTQLLNRTNVMRTEAALMYDAVYTLATGLEMADEGTPLRLVNLTCDLDKAWAFGSSLYNYFNLVNTDAGLTGKIRFYQGRRVGFSLDILQLHERKLTKIGEWTAEKKIMITGNASSIGHMGFLGNKTLKVTTIFEPPYVMYKKTEQTLAGNDKYEGFCIDLLYEIAQKVGFKYEIVMVPDDKYGTNNKETGEWNGMVGELLYKRADLAVASLSISYLREQVIDFTKPYMNLGISILFKRPKRESPGLFSFLNPLAIEIWLYVIAAYFVVSLVMFIVARFSPYEWYNPHPCNPETDMVENVFTLSNSFWFAVGTLMQQGSDINPKAVSTRIVGGIWWFFTLIIISSYTANLAAFLTVERMVSPIESAEDLSKQTKIAYGTISGGSTMTFFRESRIPTYQRMWNFMESHEPSVFVRNSQEGINRVTKGNYAFLMESTMIDYTIQRKCDLMQVGGLLDSKGYGIGTPEDSPYRDIISMTILSLQENGRIQMLYNKWWKNTGTCNHDEKTQDKANSLGVANVGGIFVVLFVGLALAILMAVVEFMWNSRKNAHREHRSGIQQRSLWSEMLEELRFAIRCHGSTKKPALRRECSKCVHYPDTMPHETHNGIILKEMNPGRTLKQREAAHREHLLHRDGPARYNVEDVTYRDYSVHT